jgi:two-component system CheB/CheR fusion protein
MAMLLLEHAQTLDAAPSIQIFGCDLDESAIQVARAGVYPDTIAADVSKERLRHFFIKEPRGYHIRREVREVVLFAAHDLLKDAPFSRMDLISCRNLLIYLNRDAQNRVLDIFHFAFRPHGLLFLGTSESVEDGSALFQVFDKKHRIYRHCPASRMGLPVPTGPSTLVRTLEAQGRSSGGPVVPGWWSD